MAESKLFGEHDNFASGVQHISAATADELQNMIAQLRGPVVVKAIYASGTRHFCWFQSPNKVTIKKKTKG